MFGSPARASQQHVVALEDDDVIMASNPSLPKEVQPVDAIMDSAPSPPVAPVDRAATLRTQTQAGRINTRAQTQTQLPFDTQMTDRDSEAVCSCGSKVR